MTESCIEDSCSNDFTIQPWIFSGSSDTAFLMTANQKTFPLLHRMLSFIWLCFFEQATLLFPQTLETSIDQLLKPYDRHDAPGIAVGVMSQGQTVYAKGWGMADLEHRIPITPDSVFDIASVSKQFAGIAIAILESEGKLTLNDRINDHVSGLPDAFAPVELRHLLHHTSGIRDWPGVFVLGGRRFDDVISFQDILGMARRQEALSFSPGEMYTYSNTGYNLLARTVETISGEAFADWMKDQVFIPLEMNHSHFHDHLGILVSNRVRSYQGARQGPFTNVGNQLMALGSSSLYSTVNDLLKWVAHLDQPTLVNREVIEKMVTPGLLNNGESAGYAYGLSIGEYRGVKRISHSGGWAGFRTYLLYLPKFELGIVVLSNWSGMNTSATAYQIAGTVLGDKLPQETKRILDPPSSKKAISAPITRKWIGTYQIDDNTNTRVNLYERNTQPWILLPNGVGVMLEMDSPHTFVNTRKTLTVTCSDGVNGWPRSLKIQSPEWSGAATEGASTEFDESELAEYEGIYYSTELLTEYHLKVDEQTLQAIHHRHDPTTLTLFAKDRFTSNVWYWSQVDFDRAPSGLVTGMRVTQGRNRNIKLIKKQIR